MTTVLVVVPAGRMIGDWFEQEGFEVLVCPGPREPDYDCIAGSGYSCPLVDAADVVVLDLCQRSDEAMSGTPGWELMLYYLGRGSRVVAIKSADCPRWLSSEESVRILDRPISRTQLVGAVRALSALRYPSYLNEMFTRAR